LPTNNTHNNRKQKETTTFTMVGTRGGKKKGKIQKKKATITRGRTNKPTTEQQRGSNGRGKVE
jgi:hypothetical protein